uniref:trypsin n=1 Tax=Gasterosteus aculeatus TaxID=69293 RepID=G3PHM4_GASAC
IRPDTMATIVMLLLLVLGGADGSHIVGGRDAAPQSRPYMASLQIRGQHNCGGALVREDFVPTAAHCQIRGEPTSVVLGSHNLRTAKDVNRYDVKLCKHPSYVGIEEGDDIMLLKLSRKVRLDKSVKPIQLLNGNMKIKDKSNCRVAGWGWTRSQGKMVNELNVVDVPVVNLEVCKKQWAKLPANVICAGGYGTDKGFCRGDSGGPLVCNGKPVGVVSFNMRNERNCDYPNVPNVYTDIIKYLPWIKQVLKKRS